MNEKILFYWIIAYFIGAIPNGWIIVRLVKQRDIRYMGSGRTGMSNVIRNAGKKWGYLTGILDTVKGFIAVKLCSLLVPGAAPWVPAIAGLLAVIGHIYSLFMIEKRRNGEVHLRGGAGGVTSVGAGLALWVGYAIGLPFSIILYFVTGITSLATGTFNIFGAIVFGIAAGKGIISPWYVLYCIGAAILICISLIPNIKRLLKGEERKTGIGPRK